MVLRANEVDRRARKRPYRGGLALVLMAALHGPPARAEPGAGDAGTARKSQPLSVAQVLYSTSELSRLHVRCRESPAREPADDAAEPLHCVFVSVALSPRPPEKMATLENYAEILRNLTAQCRARSPRTELARQGCKACGAAPSDACLYLEAMKQLKKQSCGATTRSTPHENPAVRALEQAATERGASVRAITERFCAACVDDPSAECFSRFWHSVEAPHRCTIATASFALTLARQEGTYTWTGNLGGPCSPQVALSYDARSKTWTYRQVRLAPEKCATEQTDESIARAARPTVYSSAAKYAFSDLAARCEQVHFL